KASPPQHDLHSFPTRRSSDLRVQAKRTDDSWAAFSWPAGRRQYPSQYLGRYRASRHPDGVHCGLAESFEYLSLMEILYSQAWRKDRKSTRLNSSHDQISYAVF